MSREKLMERIMNALSKLPDQQLMEVSDFAEFLVSKTENWRLSGEIQTNAADSKPIKFNNVARFRGLLSNEEADNFHKYLRQARGEWNRDI